MVLALIGSLGLVGACATSCPDSGPGLYSVGQKNLVYTVDVPVSGGEQAEQVARWVCDSGWFRIARQSKIPKSRLFAISRRGPSSWTPLNSTNCFLIWWWLRRKSERAGREKRDGLIRSPERSSTGTSSRLPGPGRWRGRGSGERHCRGPIDEASGAKDPGENHWPDPRENRGFDHSQPGPQVG